MHLGSLLTRVRRDKTYVLAYLGQAVLFPIRDVTGLPSTQGEPAILHPQEKPNDSCHDPARTRSSTRAAQRLAKMH